MYIHDIWFDVQNRHSSLPVKSTTPQKVKQSRVSLPATLEPHSSLMNLSSLSPVPLTLSPTPTHSRQSSTSHSRQLSEIEEVEEKRKLEPTPDDRSSSLQTRTETKKSTETKSAAGSDSEQERGGRKNRDIQQRGEKGGSSRNKPEIKSAKHHGRRHSAANVEVGGIKSVRSRENLLQMEKQGSHSRPESPSVTSLREISKSPSVTPHLETIKDSPRSERKNIIINRLKRIASDESEIEPLAPHHPISPSVSSQREREVDLESSLDYHKRASVVMESGLQEVFGVIQGGVEDSSSVHINSSLDDILHAMESET